MRAVEATPQERGKALENPRLAEGVLQCSMLWARAPEGQCPCAKEDNGKGGGSGAGGNRLFPMECPPVMLEGLPKRGGGVRLRSML